MALLATLEGVHGRGGDILGECLGAAFTVGSITRGCLGDEIAEKRIFQKSANFRIPDLNYTPGFNAITNEFERKIAAGTSATDAAFGVSLSLQQYGLEDYVKRVNIDSYFLPIQSFLRKLLVTMQNYPNLSLQGAAGKTYFEWLAANPKPQEAYLQNAYDNKLNALNQFMNGMGWWDSVIKARAEEARKAAGAVAQAQAAEAAKAYAEAMRKKAEQEQKIEEEFRAAQQETASATKTETATGSGLLPLALAAAAAIAFM